MRIDACVKRVIHEPFPDSNVSNSDCVINFIHFRVRLQILVIYLPSRRVPSLFKQVVIDVCKGNRYAHAPTSPLKNKKKEKEKKQL